MGAYTISDSERRAIKILGNCFNFKTETDGIRLSLGFLSIPEFLGLVGTDLAEEHSPEGFSQP